MKKLVFIFFALVPCFLLAQLKVSGTVTEIKSGDPLVGANVFVAGTDIGISTDINGYYSLSIPLDVGAEAELTARFIGYKTKSVNIPISTTLVTQDFELSVDPFKMDAVVATGVSGELTKSKTPFVIDRIDADILELVPSTSPEAMIRGKAAGVKVVKASGVPGSAASIQLRGATSINASGRSQSPLFVIDDIIIDPSVSGNPFSDISPDDMESIEIVKGAAGSSTYGSRAASGVITIKTKRGSQVGLNETRYNFKTEFGANDLIRKMDVNRSHWYRTADSVYTDGKGVNVTSGDFIDKDGNYIDPRMPRVAEPYSDSTWASGMFFSDKQYKYVGSVPGLSPKGDLPENLGDPILLKDGGFDHFDRFFQPGGFRKATFSLSRNAEYYNLHLALSNHKENGLFDFLRGFERNSIRLNSDIRLPHNLKLGLTTFISKSHQDDLEQGTGSLFFDLLFLPPDVDLKMKEDDGTYIAAPDPNNLEEANPLYQVREMSRYYDRSRALSGLTLNWALTPRLRLDGSVSYDRSNRLYSSLFPKGYKTSTPSPNINDGQLSKTTIFEEVLNAGMGASYGRKFGDLDFISRLRYTYENSSYDYTYARGWKFAVGGVPQLDVATEQSIDSEARTIRAEGFVFGSQFDYDDKYILDFSLRRDGSSLFGPDKRWHNYYRFSGAYRISEEPFWPLKNLVNEFKLRASRGTAGIRPGFAAQYETWSVVGGIVSKGNLGNKNLMPQHTTETEFGVDMVFLDRISVELTRANQIHDNQILFVPLAGYYGYGYQWQNAGTLEASALEASINAAILTTRDVNLNLGFNFDKITQKITKFNLPGYMYSPPYTQDMKVFYMRGGEEYGAIHGTKWITNFNELPEGADKSYFAKNDDGYIVYAGQGNKYTDGISELLWGKTSSTMGDTVSAHSGMNWGMPIRYVDADGETTHKIGTIVPDFSYAFSLNFRFKGLSIYTLFDGQSGGQIYNMTNQWGARDARTGEVDQTGKSEGTKKPTAYYRALYDTRNPNSHYVEDGSYLKLRELSVRYTFGVQRIGRITVGLVGRNLLTFTKYSGYDPEVGIGGGEMGSAALARFDSFFYPNYKTISGVLELEF